MRDNASVTSAGDSIVIDFIALRGLASQLRDLAQHVANRSSIVQAGLDADLFGMLTSVENDWSSHRRQLQSFLSETAASVEQIVAQYEKTDDLVASAATSR